MSDPRIRHLPRIDDADRIAKIAEAAQEYQVASALYEEAEKASTAAYRARDKAYLKRQAAMDRLAKLAQEAMMK